jgi:Mitochondrial carrier protein
VYPLDTVKRRLQAQAFYPGSNSSSNHHHGGGLPTTAFRHSDEIRPYRGMVDCARRICAEEGAASLYRGVVPSVLKSSLASALSFALYRSTQTFLEGWHEHRRRDDPR